ncbi:uncharacterized protein LOC142523437 [Primulina tabacum]|uniref:uncharacterized protein LOC142523437 n=1 Tax=Primulina tabacum TaxID=48773 RepID=UPI003F594637
MQRSALCATEGQRNTHVKLTVWRTIPFLEDEQVSGAYNYLGVYTCLWFPNNKVGLVIGKGGETIKNMQARTGARIQFAGCIKNQYYTQCQYDKVRSEWIEFVYSYVGA